MEKDFQSKQVHFDDKMQDQRGTEAQARMDQYGLCCKTEVASKKRRANAARSMPVQRQETWQRDREERRARSLN